MAFMSLMFIAIIFLTIIIVIAALCYIFTALGMFNIGKKRGLKNPWLAWIPVASSYFTGTVADEYAERYENKKTNLKTTLVVMTIITAIASGITNALTPMDYGGFSSYGGQEIAFALIAVFVLMPISIISAVFSFIALSKIYKWISNASTVMLVLSIIFPIIIPFCLFFNRNKFSIHTQEQPYGQTPSATQNTTIQQSDIPPQPSYTPPQDSYVPPQQPATPQPQANPFFADTEDNAAPIVEPPVIEPTVVEPPIDVTEKIEDAVSENSSFFADEDSSVEKGSFFALNEDEEE